QLCRVFTTETNMNTMTLRTETGTSCPTCSELLVHAPRCVLPHSPPLPTWLPAPVSPRVVRPLPAGSVKKTRQSFRAACATEFRLERVLMFFLVAAAVLGIGYGFSCLIDLVQHWAVFNAGVGQLIQ